MEVLELVLKGLLNESWEEEDAIFIHSYICTKLNGTKATQMNLPYSVLGYIPWFNPYSNSKMGDEPIPSGGFDLFLWLLCLFNPILAENLHSQMAMSGGEFYKYLVGYTASILMSVMTFLGDLLWTIARAALLILMFILLALHILIQTAYYLSLGVSMLILTSFMGGYCEFSWNFIEFLITDEASNHEQDRCIRMQSIIDWVYWEFFDLSFPWVIDEVIVDDTIYMTTKTCIINDDSTDEYGDLVFEADEPQAPPELHGNYNLISGTTYEFWTIYDDSKGGDDPPEYVHLNLIAPNGTALLYYEMNIHSDYLPDPNYGEPVNFTFTIDLSTLYYNYDENEDGLWHFYFSALDDSEEHTDLTFFPDVGYQLGPDLSDQPARFFGRSVTNDIDLYYNPAGLKSDDFIFTMLWGSSSIPSSVNLCLIPANKTATTGVSNTAGIKKFSMSTVDQNPNYSSLVEYECILNFEDLEYSDEELGRFSHYFEAVMDDDTKCYLYNIDGENIEDFDYNSKDILSDIMEPYIYSNSPQILGYTYYSADPFLYFLTGGMFREESTYKQKEIGLPKIVTLFTESELYFEVVVTEIMRSDYPKLIFENLVTSEEIEFEMDIQFLVTPFSEKFGSEAYSCVYRIKNCDLKPGVWKFRVEGKNKDGLPTNTLYGKSKFWVIGNSQQMVTNFFMMNNMVGNMPFLGFLSSMAFMSTSPWISTVMSIASMVVGLGTSISFLIRFVMSGDTGSLLALSTSTFFTGLTTGFASAGKTVTETFLKISKFGDSLASTISYYLSFLMYISLLSSFIQTTSLDFDMGAITDVLYDIINYPIDIISMVIMSVIGKLVFKFSEHNKGVYVVKACMKIYSIAMTLIGITSLIAFFIMTQGYALSWSI
jgi:hypothetical protein